MKPFILRLNGGLYTELTLTLRTSVPHIQEMLLTVGSRPIIPETNILSDNKAIILEVDKPTLFLIRMGNTSGKNGYAGIRPTP